PVYLLQTFRVNHLGDWNLVERTAAAVFENAMKDAILRNLHMAQRGRGGAVAADALWRVVASELGQAIEGVGRPQLNFNGLGSGTVRDGQFQYTGRRVEGGVGPKRGEVIGGRRTCVRSAVVKVHGKAAVVAAMLIGDSQLPLIGGRSGLPFENQPLSTPEGVVVLDRSDEGLWRIRQTGLLRRQDRAVFDAVGGVAAHADLPHVDRLEVAEATAIHGPDLALLVVGKAIEIVAGRVDHVALLIDAEVARPAQAMTGRVHVRGSIQPDHEEAAADDRQIGRTVGGHHRARTQ